MESAVVFVRRFDDSRFFAIRLSFFLIFYRKTFVNFIDNISKSNQDRLNLNEVM